MAEPFKKMCRICLHEIADDAQIHIVNNYTDLMLEAKLLQFVPEIDLSFTPNSISCQSCTNTIQIMYEFKQMCLQTEVIIKNLEDVVLNRVTLKPQDDVNKTIKKEIDLDIVDDNLIEFNTDIPVLIEESSFSNDFYCCYNCDYSTDDQKSLSKHMHDHCNMLSQKKIQPDKFNYSSSCTSNFKADLYPHNSETPYKCSKCNFSAKYKCQLDLHLTKHMGMKRHKCEKCSFSTYYQGSLSNHMLRHNKKKSYKCTLCSYSGLQLQHLKNHLLTHTDEKPFQCNECDFTTKTKYKLKSHMEKHGGPKQYKCERCHFCTYYRENLVKHRTLFHSTI